MLRYASPNTGAAAPAPAAPPPPGSPSRQAAKLCDRNFGIGGDGVIFALPGADGTDYTMHIFNADGSVAEMCGNGIRCLARFVAAADGAAPRAYRVATGAGVLVPEVMADGSVAVDMGTPVLTPSLVPTTLAANHASGAAVAAPMRVGDATWAVTAVSMGNPHCVVFADPSGAPLNLDTFPLAATGPSFESHVAFPRRTNTEFAAVLSRSRLRMRVWERGAGATLACGTGACATVVAAVLEGRADRRAVVELPGGPLDIHWRCEEGGGPSIAHRMCRLRSAPVLTRAPCAPPCAAQRERWAHHHDWPCRGGFRGYRGAAVSKRCARARVCVAAAGRTRRRGATARGVCVMGRVASAMR